MNDEPTRLHGGRLIARRLKAHGVSRLFTLSGGHLFSLYEGCRARGHRDRRRPPRGDRGVRRRGLGEGHARARRRRADRRPGRHQRHERDGLGAAEPLADGRARRPRARVPLGPGLAAGDRPRAVRAAGGQARRDRGRDAGDPGPGRRGLRRRARARTPARCSSTSRSTSSSSEADVEEVAERHRAARRCRPTAPRSSARVALLADAERPVIMAGTNLYWGRGEEALQALAEARGIPVFLNGLGARLRARRSRARVRARPQDRAGRGRRRARHRRADGLPARLRRGVRRGRRDRRDRRRRARARAPARGRRRALRRPAPRR